LRRPSKACVTTAFDRHFEAHPNQLRSCLLRLGQGKISPRHSRLMCLTHSHSLQESIQQSAIEMMASSFARSYRAAYLPAVLLLIIISGLFGLSLGEISAWINSKPLLATTLFIMFVVGLLMFSTGLVFFMARVYMGAKNMDALMARFGLEAEAGEKAMSFLIYYSFMLLFITALLL